MKGIPLREEYEYNIANELNPVLDIKIKPETKIRLYQVLLGIIPFKYLSSQKLSVKCSWEKEHKMVSLYYLAVLESR